MQKKRGLFLRFLDWVEIKADKLPDPFYLFFSLAFIVILLSWILSMFEVSVVHPGSGETVFINNLLSSDGIRRILTGAVSNFIAFPPLGIVLVTIIGIGVADRSGFFAAALKQFVSIVPAWALTSTLIFTGIISNVIADAGIVVLPPLGALLFLSMGRHPIAGLAAGFAGVCGGFSANLLITGLDPLLSELTQPAAAMIDPEYQVLPTANYYFMIASTFVVTAVCTYVTIRIVEPRLGKWERKDGGDTDNGSFHEIGKKEKKALFYSYIAAFITLVIISFLVIPENGILRGPDGGLMPFYKSIVILIMLIFLICGMVYGFASGAIKGGKGLVKMMNESMGTMGSYIILAFAAGQFIAYFSWSNLGIVTAVKGADFLRGIGLEGLPLIAAFFIFSTVMNIFIYSASGKWAVFAPVFVPMFMLLGVSPEATQAVYRVGDSITNIVTPLLPYFPIVIVFAKKFDPEMSYGKLLTSLIPFSIALFIIWGIFLLLWFALSIPFGPGAPVMYQPGL